MLKKIAIGLVLLIVVLGVAANYLYSNLDSILKTAIEKYGSAATQTAVRLDTIKLSLTSGEGSLKGLSVGSPSGFSAAKAFYLGAISIKVDTKSVPGNGPIIISDITIEQPQIAYEIDNSGDSNLKAIARNTQNYAGGSNKSAETKPTKASGPSRKIIISNLTIRNGQIAITQPMLQGHQLEAPLPTIHLTNIGKSSGGASPAEVADVLISTVAESASKIAATDVAKQLGNLKNITSGVAVDAVTKATSGAGSVEGQLKGLLGN